MSILYITFNRHIYVKCSLCELKFRPKNMSIYVCAQPEWITITFFKPCTLCIRIAKYKVMCICRLLWRNNFMHFYMKEIKYKLHSCSCLYICCVSTCISCTLAWMLIYDVVIWCVWGYLELSPIKNQHELCISACMPGLDGWMVWWGTGYSLTLFTSLVLHWFLGCLKWVQTKCKNRGRSQLNSKSHQQTTCHGIVASNATTVKTPFSTTVQKLWETVALLLLYICDHRVKGLTFQQTQWNWFFATTSELETKFFVCQESPREKNETVGLPWVSLRVK